MNDIAIRVENLGKMYHIGRAQQRHDTLRDLIVDTAAHIADWGKRRPKSDDTIWALKDVSFEVRRGEVVGIIGRNGAGKSTLLKILSRITEPTTGRAEIHGRVGSLLEVGTGFHLELTGRENIYLNGAILGMHRSEIDKKFDEIVAFAEIEKFLDTPVKRYSSGMYVRLAFAVAAHLEPEILLVDEVLAVGDAAFQKKALGKMGDVTREGRTVLFVSHNMGAMQNLTTRAFCLRDGEVAIEGQTGTVVERYLHDSDALGAGAVATIEYYRREVLPDSPVKTVSIGVAPAQIVDGVAVVPMSGSLRIHFKVRALCAVKGASVTIVLRNSRDVRVALLFSWDYGFDLSVSQGDHNLHVTVEDLSLPPGDYSVDIGINQTTQTRAYDLVSRFPLFRVSAADAVQHWPDRSWGAVHISRARWQMDDE